MAVLVINSPNNTNASYGYFGSTKSSSLSLGSQNSNYGSKVIDGLDTDKILSSGVFSYNNSESIIARYTNSISTVNNTAIKNMGQPPVSTKTYPYQELFGKEYSYQYIYSMNPNKDRIGVF